MLQSLKNLRRCVFGIAPVESSFDRRGFYHSNDRSREHLENIGRAFLCGYDQAIVDADLKTLPQRLNFVDPELRGFAFEGAAMGLSLLDQVTPWKGGRLKSFMAGSGKVHIYMVHVGAGWAIARLPWLRRRWARCLQTMDPLLRWLAMDGYGFHEGYFHWPRSVVDKKVPKSLSGYACRAFDQGLGRSLWFVHGADSARISQTIEEFDRLRRPDLWSGVGLACTYAGGAQSVEMETLKRAAGTHRPALAQGAAFAAKARQRAGNVTDSTELGCQILCGLSTASAAKVTDVALQDLPEEDEEPAYEVWRRRIQERLAPGN